MDPQHEDTVEVIASKLLKNKIFSGVYEERRLIESLAAYKDVIVVHESEEEFISCLRKAHQLLKTKCRGPLTTCISESASQYSLLTNINGVAFGSHWFQIRGLTVNHNAVNINVKYLRSMTPKQMSSNQPIFEWSTFSINSDTLKNVSVLVTKENMVQCLRFILVVFLALLMGCYQLLLLLVQLVHELNFLIRSMIPFFVACVESLTKAFGGLLILVAMMWRSPKPNATSRTTGPLMNKNRPVYSLNAAPRPNLYSSTLPSRGVNYGNIPPGQMQYRMVRVEYFENM